MQTKKNKLKLKKYSKKSVTPIKHRKKYKRKSIQREKSPIS